MDRIIKLADVEAAVARAYEDNKSIKEGAIDNRVSDKEAGKFAVAVALTDGTLIHKGDTDALFCLGSLSKVPLSAVLLSQNSPDEMLKKSGRGCICQHKAKKPDVPISCHGLRAVSAVQPVGDPEGKWFEILEMIKAMSAADPVLSDKAYEEQVALNKAADVENKLAEAGYYLLDDAPIAIDLYSKLQAMQVNVDQLATMGAVVAAEGRNAATGVPAFDAKTARFVASMMLSHGPHKMNKMWLFRYAVPAKAGWGGGFLAVVPGTLAVAAYAPELNEVGVSVKASKAVAQILDELDLNVLAADKARVEK